MTGPPEPSTMVICLCAFNRGRKILPTLHALAEQDRAGGRITRILVVDNGSRDETPAIVSRFIAEHADARMRLVIEPTPGKSEVIRRAFAATDEPVVAIIDDDCLPQADWAWSLLRAVDAQPRAGIVGGRVHVTFETGPRRVARRYITSFGPQDFGPVRRRVDGVEEFLGGASQAIRRRAMLDSGWLDRGRLTCLREAELSGGEDVELCHMVRRAGWELWYEPGAVLEHVIPASRQSLGEIARLRESVARVEPWLKWTAHGEPDEQWVRGHLDKARRRYVKTLLLEWRPVRRRIRLAERRGRRLGWRIVTEHVSGQRDAPNEPRPAGSGV